MYDNTKITQSFPTSGDYYYMNNYPKNYSNNDERLVGGFAFPFLLGGVTGAALAPAFFKPGYGYNRPQYYPYSPVPYYSYQPRRWF